MNKNLIKELGEVQYLLKIDNINEEDIIINNGKNDTKIEKYFMETFKKRDDLLKKIKENKNSQEGILKARNTTRKIKIYNSLFKIFTNKDNYDLIDIDKNNNFIKNKLSNIQYENLLIKPDLTKISNLYNKSELNIYDCYKKLMNNLPELYLHLKENGNVIFIYVNPSYDALKFIFLCSILFEEVYLIHRYMIFCKNFKNDIKHLKIITDINQNDYKFYLSEKIKLDKIFEYLKIHIKLDYNFKYELVVKRKKDLYSQYFYNYLNFINQLGLDTIHNIKKNIKRIEKLVKNKEKKNLEEITTYDEKYLIKLLNKYKVQKILFIGDDFKKILNQNNNQTNILDITTLNKEDDVMIKLNTFLAQKLKFDTIYLENINDFNDLLFYIMFSEKLLNKDKLLIINNAHFNDINKCMEHVNNTLESYKKIDGPANYAYYLRTAMK